ncbi:putative ABC transporter permease subunit, partial [Romboutsia timonensis]|uniref:putative ABC transporter permease subunit n=1 Tax=Romboutsia timonensis TaxID=1776391 RepID=UPI0039949579
FASTSYVFNTLGITAMLVIMSIVSVFSGDEVLGMISKGAGRVIVLAVAAMFGVMSGMASTTPSSISIEGKNLWILKSLPIDIRDIFKAKVSMSLILSIPAIVISSLIISFGLIYQL